jgi:hypothetical protein
MGRAVSFHAGKIDKGFDVLFQGEFQNVSGTQYCGFDGLNRIADKGGAGGLTGTVHDVVYIARDGQRHRYITLNQRQFAGTIQKLAAKKRFCFGNVSHRRNHTAACAALHTLIKQSVDNIRTHKTGGACHQNSFAFQQMPGNGAVRCHSIQIFQISFVIGPHLQVSCYRLL